MTDNELSQRIAHLEHQLQQTRAENHQLRQTLAQQTRTLDKLVMWLQSLQRDIHDVYQSFTWKAGNLITQLILKLLRRPAGVTARDHVDRIVHSFETWRDHYVAQHELDLFPPNQITEWHDTQEYQQWLTQYQLIDSIAILKNIQTWHPAPRISLLLPLSPNMTIDRVDETLPTIQQQLYPNWQLIILNQTVERETLETLAATEPRIHLIHLPESLSLVELLNQGLTLVEGEFIAVLPECEQLPPDALLQLVKVIQKFPEVALIYADEDFMNEDGQRCAPYFKTDWNPDLFYAQNFLTGLTCYRTDLVKKLQFQEDIAGLTLYDLSLRVLLSLDTAQIHHIPQILCHRHQNFDNYPHRTSLTALERYFQQLARQVVIIPSIAGHSRIIYPLPSEPPLVTIIIPTRDQVKLLQTIVTGILQHTDYPALELIIVDNGSVAADALSYLQQLQQDSRIRVLRHDAEFNYSQLNNLAVTQARGEILALLNNDLEIIHADWLKEMVSQALRPEVGAVGAKLYYSNNMIQHAGVIVGLGGLAGHGFKFLPKQFAGYYWKPFLTQNYSAVTGACLVLRKEVYEKAGGLNEVQLKVAFNDVDLCLKIQAQGYWIVWTPHAELYHHESVSRGADLTVRKYLRLQREIRYMQTQWATQLKADPFYNPNLTIQFEDFSLAYPPRLPA